ncbi:hypothetical protein [Amycolatopsis sp. NPDC021455]|uniref:hypothetical protein n=1 Tax=Amycolatopsis sp. NPDC021455 TaxID=3154901 RepID=UPI0033EC33ED
MSNANPTQSQELSPELNHLRQVRALFEKYGVAKNRVKRAEEVGVDLHVINRIFKPGTATYVGIPKSERISAIATFLGCSYNEVFLAFAKDLYPQTQDCAEVVERLLRLTVNMSDRKRRAIVELAKVVDAATTEQRADVVRYAKRTVPLWVTSTESVTSDTTE